jgi:hypothetical protein
MHPENSPEPAPNQHDNNPMPIPAQPSQPMQTNTTPQNTAPAAGPLTYDSNPFTISIHGFQLLIKYAQSVVITILVLGLISFMFNFVGEIASFMPDNSASAQQDDVSETLNSLQDGAQLDYTGSYGEDGISDTGSLDADNSTSSDVSGAAIATIVAIGIGIFLVVVLVTIPISVAFSAAFKGFIAAGMIAALQHRKISFGEALSAMANRFGALFGAELISTLKIIGGYILFIVPGVRAQLRYEALPYVIMNDPSIKAKEAISQTKDLYENHLMEVFGIKFFAGIIPAIGSAFAAGGIGLSMQQLQAYEKAQLATPKTHWLNYLGLLLVGLLILSVVGLSILLIAIATN